MTEPKLEEFAKSEKTPSYPVFLNPPLCKVSKPD